MSVPVRMNPVEGISLVEHEVFAHSDRATSLRALMERRREIDRDNFSRKSSQDHFLRFVFEQLT